jgi:hypothetical protein
MLAEIEEKDKYETIKSKQFIIMFNVEAWKRVSKLLKVVDDKQVY